MFCMHWKHHPFHEHLEDEDKLATGDILLITLPDIQAMHGEEHCMREFRILVDPVESIDPPFVVRNAGDLVFTKANTRPFSIPVYIEGLEKHIIKLVLGPRDQGG